MGAAIMSTSTSMILLNGIPGDPIRHGRGLGQGDPLSRMLFILAIDPLQILLDIATEQGLLSSFWQRHVRLHTSMDADDAVTKT